MFGDLLFICQKSFFKEQSAVLLDKIKSVSKLITVEGNFNEVIHFSDVKNSLLNMVSSKKKAIVLQLQKYILALI